ncbi:unnamed protein product, partial [Schistosoma turkestanicum]
MSWCNADFFIAFAVLSLISWCGAIFIVISLTFYYLLKYSDDYSLLYMTLVCSFEFVILLIISQYHVNAFFHC